MFLSTMSVLLHKQYLSTEISYIKSIYTQKTYFYDMVWTNSVHLNERWRPIFYGMVWTNWMHLDEHHTIM